MNCDVMTRYLFRNGNDAHDQNTRVKIFSRRDDFFLAMKIFERKVSGGGL
jgi:hypothetical protein